MTLEDLLNAYDEASNSVSLGVRTKEDRRRAGIRAVVTALRDEMLDKGIWTEDRVEAWMNEILASDGEDKAAGGSTRKTEHGDGTTGATSAVAVTTPAAAPTADDWLSLVKGTTLEPYAGVSETKGVLFTETKPEAAHVFVGFDIGKTEDVLVRAERHRAQRLRVALVGVLKGIGDEPCWYDHHGNCQAHFVTARCEVAVARKALEDDKQ